MLDTFAFCLIVVPMGLLLWVAVLFAVFGLYEAIKESL